MVATAFNVGPLQLPFVDCGYSIRFRIPARSPIDLQPDSHSLRYSLLQEIVPNFFSTCGGTGITFYYHAVAFTDIGCAGFGRKTETDFTINNKAA